MPLPQRVRAKPPRIDIASIFLLTAMLALPALAFFKLVSLVPWPYLIGYLILIQALTGLFYHMDKKRALLGHWRMPESQLHLGELLGGWPTAFLLQRTIRHKISKSSYQITFWTIVMIYQFVALEFLNDWEFSGFIYSKIRNLA
jgi:uncharacterized membrane protein YsdA (DUF1294 family)